MGGSRDEDAFLTTTTGRLEEVGESTCAEVEEVDREREKVTGDGEGVLEGDGDDEPDALRRTCNGRIGNSVTGGVGCRCSTAPTVIPLGRARVGLDRFREILGASPPAGGSLSRAR